MVGAETGYLTIRPEHLPYTHINSHRDGDKIDGKGKGSIRRKELRRQDGRLAIINAMDVNSGNSYMVEVVVSSHAASPWGRVMLVMIGY